MDAGLTPCVVLGDFAVKRSAIVTCLAFWVVFPVVSLAHAAWNVELAKVIDGDSLVVRYLGGRPSYGYRRGQKVEVRLQGIDAPEYRQAYGRRAARALADLLVRAGELSLEPLGKDRYGRVLAMLYLAGPDGRKWVNEMMVSRGHAWVYRKYNQDLRLMRAEKTARRDRLGLWAQRNPEPPWKYRARRR